MSSEVTQLLIELADGDTQVVDRLVPLVYPELRKLAEQALGRERSGHTLQPTALVHEVYLKLVDQRQDHWKNRAHFFAVAATSIRRILVDHARRKCAEKRGGGARRVELSPGLRVTEEPSLDLIALDEALDRFAEIDGRKSRVVELRYFAGLSVKETAEVLSVSHQTVERDWTLARAWLYRELCPDDSA